MRYYIINSNISMGLNLSMTQPSKNADFLNVILDVKGANTKAKFEKINFTKNRVKFIHLRKTSIGFEKLLQFKNVME